MTFNNAVLHIISHCKENQVHPSNMVSYAKEKLNDEWKELDTTPVCLVLTAQRELAGTAYL